MGVSILLPFHDAAPTIAEAVASVTHDAVTAGLEAELVLVDDRSTDGSAELAEAACADGVVVVHGRTEGEGGLVAALQEGLRLVRHPLVARMDADDISLAGRLRAQVNRFGAEPGLALVATPVDPFASEGEVGEGLRAYCAWQNGLRTHEDMLRERFVEAPVCHPTVMFQRDIVREAGGFRAGPFPEDYELWLRLLARGERFAKTDEIGLRWRHSGGRVTFSDERLSPEGFRRAKAAYLAPLVRGSGRELAVWGAGRDGKRLARTLEQEGVHAARFVDIDPRKIGGVRRGVPIVGADALDPERDLVVTAVGVTGARDLIRDALDAAGFREGSTYFCAA